MLSLLKYELFSRCSAILGWGIGLSTIGILYIAIQLPLAEIPPLHVACSPLPSRPIPSASRSTHGHVVILAAA